MPRFGPDRSATLSGVTRKAACPSPRDRFVTVFGRKPVIEALQDETLTVDKVVVADTARGEPVREIRALAQRRGVPVHAATAQRVKVLAGNGKQDQGVLADVRAPRMRPLDDALEDRRLERALLLDGITTPANVGMILRTATAAGIDGIVVPHKGVAALDPLVVKASAGIAFHAPILRAPTAPDAAEALSEAGFGLYGLGAGGDESLFRAELPRRAAFVLGAETTGISAGTRARIGGWLAIPMPGPVESLNVAGAAAVLCFELVRRTNE